MSALQSHAPWPVRRMSMMVDGCVLHGEVWTRNGTVDEYMSCGGKTKPLFSIYYFNVAIPVGLIRKTGMGGLSNGPIMNPSLTSLANRMLMVSVSE